MFKKIGIWIRWRKPLKVAVLGNYSLWDPMTAICSDDGPISKTVPDYTDFLKRHQLQAKWKVQTTDDTPGYWFLNSNNLLGVYNVNSDPYWEKEAIW